MRVRELVRATIGGRQEQDRQQERVRATIDLGMGRECQRADELRRREEPRGTVELEVEEPVAAEEPG